MGNKVWFWSVLEIRTIFQTGTQLVSDSIRSKLCWGLGKVVNLTLKQKNWLSFEWGDGFLGVKLVYNSLKARSAGKNVLNGSWGINFKVRCLSVSLQKNFKHLSSKNRMRRTVSYINLYGTIGASQRSDLSKKNWVWCLLCVWWFWKTTSTCMAARIGPHMWYKLPVRNMFGGHNRGRASWFILMGGFQSFCLCLFSPVWEYLSQHSVVSNPKISFCVDWNDRARMMWWNMGHFLWK